MNEQNAEPEEAEKSSIVPINPATEYCVQFKSSSGETLTFSGTYDSVGNQLRDAVLAGKVRGDTIAIIQVKISGQWRQRDDAIRNLLQLESIYKPIGSRFAGAIGFGALIGFSLEAAYQSWLLFQHYHTFVPVLLFWLPIAFFLGLILDEALGSPILKFLFPGIIMALLGGSLMERIDQIAYVLVPTFSALVVSAAIGTTLGISLAGSLVGIWILRHRQQFPVAPDAAQESLLKFKTWIVILLIVFVGLSVAYIGWMQHWPLSVEIYMRKGL